VSFVVIFDELSVSSVAKGSVGGVLTVAEFVVSAFGYVELQWTATSHIGVAAAVAVRVVERNAARAPVVHFAFLEVSIVWEPTYIACRVPAMNGMLGGLYFPSL
jgi:hypothetical protein